MDSIDTIVEKRIDALNKELFSTNYYIESWKVRRRCPWREDIYDGWYIIVEEAEFEEYRDQDARTCRASDIRGKLVDPEGKEYLFYAEVDERLYDCRWPEIEWTGDEGCPENFEDIDESFKEAIREM